MFQPLFFLKVSVAVSVELWYMFVLQGGERMKYKLLKDLYDCFYTPPELSAQKQEIERLNAYISGLHTALRRQPRITIYGTEVRKE